LAASCDGEARAFGQLVLDTLEVLMAAVYAAREGPPRIDLPTQHAPLLTKLRTACEQHQHSAHQKTPALAVEFLNDWAAIFQVLSHPELPLTNNEAERALRHGVIWWRTSLGTQSAEGSQFAARLLTVVFTLRAQQRHVLEYLTAVCEAARQGLPAPSLLPDPSLLEQEHPLAIAA
jgi:hypothetical protein